MKKTIRIASIVAFLALAPVLSMAQPPHPGGAGSGGATPVGAPGGSGPIGGGGAPIDGGLSIFLALGIAYGGRKVYQWKKAE